MVEETIRSNLLFDLVSVTLPLYGFLKHLQILTEFSDQMWDLFLLYMDSFLPSSNRTLV